RSKEDPSSCRAGRHQPADARRRPGRVARRAARPQSQPSWRDHGQGGLDGVLRSPGMIALEFPEQGRRLTRFLAYDIDASFFLPPHRFTFQLANVRGFDGLRELTQPLTPVNIYQDEDFVLSGVILDQEIQEDDTIQIRGL